VALISTFETRELREMPWYGLLSNHAGIALAAVVGGVVYLESQHWLAAVLPQDPRASQLASLVLASLVISLLSSGIASVTMMLRDRLTTPSSCASSTGATGRRQRRGGPRLAPGRHLHRDGLVGRLGRRTARPHRVGEPRLPVRSPGATR
jgi:hypothetical protein